MTILSFPFEGTIQHKFKVHRLNNEMFRRFGEENSTPGEICVCGHPVALHSRECNLYRTCGCTKPNTVIWASDCRPFFQVTHGPMEAHALGRGMTLAQSLGIEISGELHCQNYCKERQIIGAVRHTKTSKSIAVRKIDGERHSLRCNHCVEDLCLEPGVWRVGFYDG